MSTRAAAGTWEKKLDGKASQASEDSDMDETGGEEEDNRLRHITC
jgi:hypothetical protein